MNAVVGLERDAIGRAAQRHGVSELSVFGSAVSGDFHGASDVDFLVEFLTGRTDPLQDLCGLRDDLERIVERDVNIVVKRAIRNPSFRDSALAHTKTIYVANRAARLDHMARRGTIDLPPAEEVLAQERPSR